MQCSKNIDPRTATHDSVGLFQLTEQDATIARILIAVSSVRAYVTVASNIRDEEIPGQYCNDRMRLNLEDALATCDWLHEYLEEVQVISQ